MLTRIHATARIENDVQIGARCAIWDHVHIRARARLGDECIVGEKTCIAYDVRIGHRVKINAFVHICTGVEIEDGVMISAGAVFTNDRTPRATTPDLTALRSSAPDEHTLRTKVRHGATIGARSVIGPGLTIGCFAMTGMGAVVTRSVPDFHLAVGQPARSVGCVCRCGEVVMRFVGPPEDTTAVRRCSACARVYTIEKGRVREGGLVDSVRPLRTATTAAAPIYPHDAA